MPNKQDTNSDWPVTTFEGSPQNYLKLELIVLGLCLLGVVMASGYFIPLFTHAKPGPEMLAFYRIAGTIIAVLFGFIAVIYGMQALRGGVAVSVGPEGVRDTRLSDAWIPWSAIEGLRTLNTESGIPEISARGVVLEVEPTFLRKLKLTPIARFGRWVNAAFGQKRDLMIAQQGLRGDLTEVKAAIRSGMARAQQAHTQEQAA